MIAVGMRYKTPVSSAIRGMYVRWAIYGLLFGLLPMFRVDNAAHIGGLAAGFAVAYTAGLPRVSVGTREKIFQPLAVACIVIAALAFLQMYLWFRSATAEPHASTRPKPETVTREISPNRTASQIQSRS
jgi:hypothetical protein